ncbi:DUF6266 family protein [Pedobacter gandavensis]|uniref:DUF6266 family protein n=1 Tax=Pedobacter gandavensis TaxID=2679963 RepID=UPI00292DE894|nr:DUF6266 family protein [Pedobacter gandavensis]
MGSVTGGPFGTFVGKVGDVVGYVRLGKAFVRNAPEKSKKPRTQGQREVNQKFQVGRKLISDLQEFINVGFRLAAEGTGKTAQNVASSWNIRHAIKGVHPDFIVDYSQVLLSQGDLPVPDQPEVEYVYPGLKFKWRVSEELESAFERDQVMLLAYHPHRKAVTHILSGNRRKVGADELMLRPELFYPDVHPENDFVETYMAFISDDRRRISDSIYTGRVYLKQS